MLTAEPEWEMVGSSAKDIAFDEFPLDDAEPASWAARLGAQKGKITKPTSKSVQKICPTPEDKLVRTSITTCQEPTFDGPCVDEDVYEFADAKQLAREAHSRQSIKGGSHTMRARGHCPIQKSSEVSILAAVGANPQDVSQLASILRQVPSREVAKHVGGTCQEVKTREGRQAILAGAKTYDVTVPIGGPEDDVDVTYRVVEDLRGGTSKVTRNPKCSAGHNTQATARGRMPECPQTRKQQSCKKDIQEGMNIMGFA